MRHDVFQKSSLRLPLILFCLIAALTSWAVPNPKLQGAAAQWLNGPGAIRGGNAENFMSLLDIRRTNSAKLKTERLMIDWGDQLRRPSPTGGYYQVEYRKNPDKVIVSFALTLSSRVESKAHMAALGNGLYIKNAHLEYDPISQSEILTLELRRPVHLKVQSLAGTKATARLMIDMVE